MKKKIFIIVLSTILFVFNMETTQSQTYGSWTVPFAEGSIKAKELQFEQGQIVAQDLNGLPPQDNFLFSAGGYAQNDDLLFYIVDNFVYDPNLPDNENPIGNFIIGQLDEMKEEVQIVRKPWAIGDVDLIFYIIHSFTAPSGAQQGMYYAEVLVSPSGAVTIGDIDQDLPGLVQNTDGAFAFAEPANDERDMFKCSFSYGITHLTLTSTGFSQTVVQILDQSNSVIGDSRNFDAYNFEMKVNCAGQNVFAWNTLNNYTNEEDKVFVFNEATGLVQNIDVNGNENIYGKISGLEFSTFEDNIIYVSYSSESGGTGLVKLDYVAETTTLIAPGDFSQTFLQRAPDGHIYGVSDDGLRLGKIDMTDGSFDPIAFEGEVLSYKYDEYYEEKYYILPENEGIVFAMEITAQGVSCGCDDENDGSATATVTSCGGHPPYTYEWTNSSGTVIGTGQTITNLGVGTYTCCVTDSYLPTPNTYCEDVQVVLDESLLDFTYGDEMFDIDNSNVNWSGVDYSFRYGIRVHDGYTLTVDEGSYLEFYLGAKIIVEPGGELIIDNSTLSYYADCQCGGWLGIEVWGDRSTHQYVCNDVRQQGKVTIKNGSLVEHAKIAVLLGARNDPGNTKRGGIVVVPNNDNEEVYSATFLNNEYALFFLPYQNYVADPEDCGIIETRPVGNFSNLWDCRFDINSAYVYGSWSNSHVLMSSVDGIDFHGCEFYQNLHTDPTAKGIDAHGSGFRVEEICTALQKPCPEGSIVESSFTNFEKAIVSANSGVHTVYIRNTNFFDNSLGVKLSNVDNAVIINSNFELGKPASCDLETLTAFGVDILGSTGFAIEENDFTKALGGMKGLYIGVRVKDSRTPSDLIYKNTYVGLSYGNFAEGDNRFASNDIYGLEYQCNNNAANAIDFIVTGNDPNSPPRISTYQGYFDKEAGNVFSVNPKQYGHFRNEGTQAINYYYLTDPPIYYTPVLVVPINDAGENTCPSHYGGGGSSGTDKGVVLTPEEKEQTEQDFATGLSDYNNVKALFDNLKDGGNTEVLLNEVELSWPSDMWELRAELLGKSPHLSKEVLMTAADKTDVLPESILFEILSANPDELRKEDLIKYLEDKEQPLPGYMIDILKQLAGGVTYKTILLNEMAKHNATKAQAAYDLIRSTINDTVMDYQYLRNWLENLNNMNADMQIVSSYIAEGDHSSAQTMLDMIPGLYALEGNELGYYNDYKSLTEMQMAWQQQGHSVFELDSSEVAALVGYADNSSGKAARTAQGILNFAHGFDYCECPPVSDTTVWKNSNIDQIYKPDESTLFIQALPNPANTWAAFNYKLPAHIRSAILQLTDINGRNIVSFTFTAKQGQYVWDIRDVERGIYLFTLKAGSLSKSGKLIVE